MHLSYISAKSPLLSTLSSLFPLKNQLLYLKMFSLHRCLSKFLSPFLVVTMISLYQDHSPQSQYSKLPLSPFWLIFSVSQLPPEDPCSCPHVCLPWAFLSSRLLSPTPVLPSAALDPHSLSVTHPLAHCLRHMRVPSQALPLLLCHSTVFPASLCGPFPFMCSTSYTRQASSY